MKAIYVSFSINCGFMSFATFSTVCLLFLLSISRNSLGIRDVSPFVIRIADSYFQFIISLFFCEDFFFFLVGLVVFFAWCVCLLVFLCIVKMSLLPKLIYRFIQSQ